MRRIGVHHYLEKEEDWFVIEGAHEAFMIWAEADDYVEETNQLMQQIATKLYHYPFYIHFEAYEDGVESILSKRNLFDISYQNTRRKVLITNGFKMYQAEIPSFSVKITNQEILQKVFVEWFHLASENMMWLITQNKIYYKNGYAYIDSQVEPLILSTDHDAQGFTLTSSNNSLKTREKVISLFDNGKIEFHDL